MVIFGDKYTALISILEHIIQSGGYLMWKEPRLLPWKGDRVMINISKKVRMGNSGKGQALLVCLVVVIYIFAFASADDTSER